MKPNAYTFIITLIMVLMTNACIRLDEGEPEIRIYKTVSLRSRNIQDRNDEKGFNETLNPTNFLIDQKDSYIDLDTGEHVVDENADLSFNDVDGYIGIYSTELLNNTISIWVGFIEPGYKGCKYGLTNLYTENYGLHTKEKYFTCLLTNEGRISQIKVENTQVEGNEAEVKFILITWEPIIELSE